MDELMQDFDNDKYTEAFCKRKKCTACDGTDFEGEANGYGCIELDEYIDMRYNSLLKRRLKKKGRE